MFHHCRCAWNPEHFASRTYKSLDQSQLEDVQKSKRESCKLWKRLGRSYNLYCFLTWKQERESINHHLRETSLVTYDIKIPFFPHSVSLSLVTVSGWKYTISLHNKSLPVGHSCLFGQHMESSYHKGIPSLWISPVILYIHVVQQTLVDQRIPILCLALSVCIDSHTAPCNQKPPSSLAVLCETKLEIIRVYSLLFEPQQTTTDARAEHPLFSC